MKNVCDAIFFDLDGTLLDTAPDLYRAMLATLSQLGRKAITFEQFRPHVHTGTTSMLTSSLDISEEDPEFQKIREIFLKNYQNFLNKDTDYFPGMSKVLDSLDQQKIPWGIVTNKPSFLTEPLLVSFGLKKRSRCIISGDTLPEKKPNPTPLLHACKITQIAPKNAAYVGDTENDILAAKAAEMISIAVLYGYHEKSSQPDDWGADHLIKKPLQILDVLSIKQIKLK